MPKKNIFNANETDQMKKTLGLRIRKLRNERKLKVADLSQQTGLTSSTISQLERAIIFPSVASLKKICDALGVPIAYLFEDTVPPEVSRISSDIKLNLGNYLSAYPSAEMEGISPVVRRHSRKMLLPTQGIRYYLLNPTFTGLIEMIYNEYDPGSTTGPTLYAHPGNECGVILSGELTVQINEEVFILKEGDSITFQSSSPHMMKNDSDVICTSIWVNVPPWF
jgi:transcriptional regulator with XRE-family HTH domain